jgi:hypothetical protein
VGTNERGLRDIVKRYLASIGWPKGKEYHILTLAERFPDLLLEQDYKELVLRCLFIMAGSDDVTELTDSGGSVRRERLTPDALKTKLEALNISVEQDDLTKLLENPAMPASGVLNFLNTLAGDDFKSILAPIIKQQIFTGGFAETIKFMLDTYPELKPAAIDALLDSRLDLKSLPYDEPFASAIGIRPFHHRRGAKPITHFEYEAYVVNPLEGLEFWLLQVPTEQYREIYLDSSAPFLTL